MPSSLEPARPVTPDELDQYLAKGYRVAGQQVYTSEYIKSKEFDFITVYPTRIKLDKASYGKHLRKYKRKNDKRFRVEIGPARQQMQEEFKLNIRYSNLKPDKAVPFIDYHVKSTRTLGPLLRTWQTRIYDGNKLVATSYFDLGRESCYSKQGIYDPDYGRYSLGIYTMQLEIEFCKWAGKRYFYPGYVAVEKTDFDYKLRLGEAEYFHWRRQAWLPLTDKEKLPSLVEEMKTQLQLMQDALKEVGLTSRIYPYYAGNYRFSRLQPHNFIDGPYLLKVDLGALPRRMGFVISYELTGEQPFSLCYTRDSFRLHQPPRLINPADGYPNLCEIKQVIYRTKSVQEMAGKLGFKDDLLPPSDTKNKISR